MTRKEAISHRLHCQLLATPVAGSPAHVLKLMGPMQAQDISYFPWAVGVRAQSATLSEVRAEINSGGIIRAHLLRGTVHAVAAEDYQWISAYTKLRTLRTMQSWRTYTDHGRTSKQLLHEVIDAIMSLLAGHKALSRQELTDELSQLGIAADGGCLNHCLLHAEADGQLCTGVKDARTIIWMRTDERLGITSRNFSGDAALAQLTRLYFGSHSPATLHDYCWWSALPMSTCRKGVQLIASELTQVMVGDQEMLCINSNQASDHIIYPVHMIPPFDEYLIGYTDRTLALDKRHDAQVFPRPGIARPSIMNRGRIVGTWKGTTVTSADQLEVTPFYESISLNKRELKKAQQRYTAFNQ